jgi:hypothetical protein
MTLNPVRGHPSSRGAKFGKNVSGALPEHQTRTCQLVVTLLLDKRRPVVSKMALEPCPQVHCSSQ